VTVEAKSNRERRRQRDRAFYQRKLERRVSERVDLPHDFVEALVDRGLLRAEAMDDQHIRARLLGDLLMDQFPTLSNKYPSR
jgi:hypothetical protein